jgi:hypothetical protein
MLRGQLESGSISFGSAARLPSVTGLLLAGGLAIIVTVVVALLVDRDVARSERGEAILPDADATVGDRQANWAVIAVFAILALIGLVGWNSVINGTTSFALDGIQGAYPAAYTTATGDDELLRVSDALGGSSSFVIRAIPLASGQDAKSVATQLAGERGTDSSFYRVTESEEQQVSNTTALRQRFAFVDTGALVGATPQVVEGINYIIVHGDRTVVVTLTASSAEINQAEPLFERFVQSLKLS